MEMLLQDIRYGFRMFVKHPGFTLVAVFTLALGIGANTAIFSAIKAVLFDALPYPDAAQLMVANASNVEKGFARFGASYQDLEDWQKQNTVFAGLAAYQINSANLTGGAEPRRVQYAQVTANLFSVLGVSALAGRAFAPDEAQPGKDRVVVLSHAFWQEQFGGQQNVVGSSLTLGGKPVTVIGIAPPGFAFPDADTQMWKPIGMTPDQSGSRGSRWLATIARLKSGVTVAQAQTEMSAIAARLAAQYPASNKGWGVLIEPYQELLVSDVRRQLLLLWGAVGLVLLIACANVANLLLARAAERTRELAVRAALGAGRARLMRQLLVESLLLSLAGCALGLVLAEFSLDGLRQLLSELLPRAQQLTLDVQMLSYSVGLALAAGLGVGLLPAFKASRIQLTEAIKDGARDSTNAGGQRLRGVLVAGEVALAVVVLVGAGLLIRSFVALLNVNPGFDPTNVLTLRIAPPFALNPAGKDEATIIKEIMAEKLKASAFYRELLERLKTLPGVVSAGAVNRLPLTGNWWTESFAIEGRRPVNSQDMLSANGRAVLPGYFQTMGVPLLQGRALAETDNETAVPAVVINQTAARRYWGEANPIGQRLTLDEAGNAAPHWFTVVGVVGDERHNQLEVEPRPLLYFTMAQSRSGFGFDWGLDIVIKTQTEPLALSSAVRRQVLALNPNLPVFNVNSLEELVVRNLAQRRSVMWLLGALAATALLLAAVGIYGVLSYAVSRRTREIGIRLALGAQSRNISALIIRQGMTLVAIGTALGVAGALALTRLLKSLLFGVTATDSLTFVLVTSILILVALLACWLPTRRATKVDPLVALRAE